MFDRLLDALHAAPGGYRELRAERAWTSVAAWAHDAPRGARVWVEEGVMARALEPGRGWGVATTAGVEGLGRLLTVARELSLATHPPEPVLLADAPVRETEALDALDDDPRGIPLGEKAGLVERLARDALRTDRRIVGARVVYADEVVESWYVNSDGTRAHARRVTTSVAAFAEARNGGVVARAADGIGVRGGWRRAAEREAMVAAVGRRAVEQAGARPFRSGRLPVVLDSRLAAQLALEVVREAASGRLPLGTRVGSDLVTLGDDGSALGLVGSLGVDDEGCAPTNTRLVQHGAVVGRLHDRASAAAAGGAATGSARAGSWRGAPEAAPTNTYLAAGATGDREALIGGVRMGIFAADVAATRRAGGQLAVAPGAAWLIRDGAIAEPVRGLVLAGALADLLGTVDAVGADFRWHEPAGRYGPGGREGVPVAIGAPSVRLAVAELRGQAT